MVESSGVKCADRLSESADFTQMQRAAEIYARRLRVDDRSAAVAQKLATALYRDGNIDGAIAALQQAATLGERPPDAYYLLGICLREHDRLAEAARAFQQAITLATRTRSGA